MKNITPEKAKRKSIEQKENAEDIRDADIALKKHSKQRGVSLKVMKKKLSI